EHRRGLPEHAGFGEVGAARVRDGGYADAWVVRTRRKRLEPAHSGLTEAFGVGHDVGLRHRHEIRCAEKLADLDLMLQGLLADRTLLAGEDVVLLVGKPHGHRQRASLTSEAQYPGRH